VQHERIVANDLVEDVLRLLRGDLVHQGVQVQVKLAPELPDPDADRVGLQQVLINLVMNACDAMAALPRDDRRLTVSTRLDGPDLLRVSVSDNGRGIASDMLEQVFAPFYTEKANGLGLGLSVCRTIITAHGGELWADNSSGRGATFQFTLPATAAPYFGNSSVSAARNAQPCEPPAGLAAK
jgi:C4-dicarboxylate-specific signal transduction histidine kinase